MGSSRSSSTVKPPPHFFKIIHSSPPHHMLKIPIKFMSTYGKELANLVFLKVPNGKLWEVELMKCDEDAWLCNGWNDFAEYYSIGFGHLLVFRYDWDSNFHVVIFDMTASEIEYPSSGTRGNETNANPEGTLQVLDAVEIEEAGYSGLKLLVPNTKKKVVKCRKSKRGLLAQRPRYRKSRALERARAFRSENPYFTKSMCRSYISTSPFLYIPTDFSKENLSEKPEKVVLRSLNGGVWPVKCLHRRRGGSILYWMSFVRANNVKIDDVCVFELIKSTEPCLNVVIFRPGGNAMALED